jgi:hypothetical protein
MLESRLPPRIRNWVHWSSSRFCRFRRAASSRVMEVLQWVLLGMRRTMKETKKSFFLREGLLAKKKVRFIPDRTPEECSMMKNFGSRSFNSRTASYPCSDSAFPTNSASPVLNFSPTRMKSKSPDSMINFPAPVPS